MLKSKKGYIITLRESKTFRGLSATLMLVLLFEYIQPTAALALTEGPSQPEVQSFEPISTTQMVDLFTGDFNYNIPLFNLPGPNGGYPFNLSYHAGVSMDDEASWVGLGWNINAGSLVRNTRGLPDDFESVVDSDGKYVTGDFIETKNDQKPSTTVGVNFGKTPEVLGANTNLFNSYSLSLYYNNYRGIGVGVDLNFKQNKDSKFSLGLSLDSENGLGISPSLSLANKGDEIKRIHNFGFTFDGKLSVDYSLNRVKRVTKSKDGYTAFMSKSRVMGSSLGYSNATFSPSISQKITSYNLSFNLSKGTENIAGIYSGKRYGGFFSSQDFNDLEKNGTKKPVIGYSRNTGSSNEKYYTKDFTRLNEKQVNRSSNSLPYSYYTPDSYVSTGQGLSGYFRPKRKDVGHVNDPYVRNKSWGVGINLEFTSYTPTITLDVPMAVGPVIIPPGVLQNIPAIGKKLGIGGNFSFGWDTQSSWEGDLNELSFDFNSPFSCGIDENLYYQAFGESIISENSTYSGINQTDLAVVKLSPKNSDDMIMGKRRIEDEYNSIQNSQNNSGKRIVRNTLIHNLTNDEVSNLGEFNIKYYNFNANLNLFENPSNSLNRNTRKDIVDIIKSHDAGFKVLNDDGTYYVYGLPAYNNKETENLFTVKNSSFNVNTSDAEIELNQDGTEVDYKKVGTEKFISKTTKSPYAHSYLLTSIQGADYIDRTNNGPTNDDYGYWVKFDYVKYADNYKWRAPYTKSSYSRGKNYSIDDDKASYQYGEKEIWYLARAETKTHIAIFDMVPREDNKEAESEFSNSVGNLNDNLSGLKIRTIKLYDKKTFSEGVNAVPLQEVHFDYFDGTDELCKNSPNSQSANGGKLTLKSVWFTNNGSTKGELNKYQFDYASVDLASQISGYANLVNPNYSKSLYDSWGQYKPSNENHSHNSNFPYVNQFNQGWTQSWMTNYIGNQETAANKKVTKKAQDLLASAWCLRKIKLPSGGTIKIDYESDDYGYVQHKTANQMFKIVKVGNSNWQDDELYEGGTDIEGDESTRRVYFKLENPIPTGENESQVVYNDYVKPLIQDENGERNLYFKTKTELNFLSNNYEFISGYAPLENYSEIYYGADEAQTIDGEQKYTRGFVTLKVPKKKNGTSTFNYHPFSLAAWTYMQTNAQDLLMNPNSTDEYGVTLSEITGKISDLINIAPNVASSFGAIRAYLHSKLSASRIDLDNSCIRLASPDKIKFGGGHRVRTISIDDEWSSDTNNSEESRSYGQHFDYTIHENGRTISSGVAQYEPQAGGDENALKYPITEFFRQGYFTNNSIFSEAPFNESLFPSPQVGYRKVTVSSINTTERLKNAEPQTATDNSRTGGVVVNEFYTSKEFPTFWEYSYLSENNDTKDVFNVPIPIPLIGSINRQFYHGTQAYKIETNDMHGKVKSVSSYEINVNSSNKFEINGAPIAQEIYEYQCDPIVFQHENVFKLNNKVKIIEKGGNHSISQTERNKGLDVELFTDQRENKTFYNTIGLDFNLDFPMPNFPPALTFWPSYTVHKTLFRTYVTNKVVNRFGILKKVISKDLQSTSETENIAYDEKSGIPILTKIKNEFGDDFYSYNIPAYYEYDRMGHAYQNINYKTCDKPIHRNDDKGFYFEFEASPTDLEYLVRGDELLLKESGTFKRVYFLGWKYVGSQVMGMLHSVNQITSEIFVSDMKVIRSGRRNHYSTMAANYLTIGKPQDLLSNAALQIDPNDNQITTPVLTDNVLSATANLYKDDWSAYEPSNLTTSLTTENPFLTGNSGIWRPYKSYTYVGPRKSNSDLTTNNNSNNPKLYQDGVMSNVPMFSWDLGNMEDYVSNWEWTNEITKFSSDAYELENVNRLNVYSSALYGYNGSLTIGVGGNATVNEIGVMDFESVYDTLYSFIKNLAETNLNFDGNHTAGSVIIPEQFKVVNAVSNSNSTIELFTNIPYSYYISLNSQTNIGLSLISRKNGVLNRNEGYYFNASAQSVVNNSGFAKLIVQPYFKTGTTDKLLPTNGVYHGKITLLLNRPYKAITAGVSFVKSKHHTGKSSMKITAETLFDQPKLKLKANESYIVSLWVSRDNTNVKSFVTNPESVFEVGELVGNSFTPFTGSMTFVKSKIIEGWQKIDIEFKPVTENAVIAINFKPGNDAIYIDDVRFSPKTGGMSTYVYDPVRMRLVASLNVDNYATLFYYDEEGNLVLKKQETEKGIFTLTESRGHASSNN